MLRKVAFEYSKSFVEQTWYVEARVHIGTTGARGDDPSEVVSLLVRSEDGQVRGVGAQDYKDLCEMALIEAKESVAV